MSDTVNSILNAVKTVNDAKLAGTPIATEVNSNDINNLIIAQAAKVAKEKTEVVVDTPIVETTPVIDTTAVVDSSLKTDETPIVEAITTETTETTSIITKSFEDELAERFEGKYKTLDELKADLAPKPSEFANDYIAKLNELAKQGVEFNDEFWALQSKDFKSMTNPDVILLEAMRLNPDYKDWTDRELKLELDDKYKRKEWADEGDEPTDTEILARKRLARDAEAARNELIKKQESHSVKQPKPTAEQIAAANKAAAEAQAKWESFVDNDVLSKGTKLSTIIDDKTNEVFEYAISDSDKKEIGNIMKQLPNNIDAFWNEFKTANGEFDYKQIYDLLALKRNKENLIKIVAQNYRAKGAEAEVKNLKNINFKSDGTQVVTTKTVAEKNSEAAIKAMQNARLLKK